MFLGQCLQDITLSNGLAVSLFMAGLVGGFTHCAGMCSPFVLAQMDDGPVLQKPSQALLLPYHLGRMTTYVAIAVLVAGVVNMAFLFSPAKSLIAAPLLMLAGVVFIVSAFPSLRELFPWAANIKIAAPLNVVLDLSSKLMGRPSAINRYGLGVLLGFMPCGLVVSAVLAASASGNAGDAALAMSAFALGTMPALVLVALGGHALKQKYPNASRRFTQGAMVLSSLWLFALAGNLVF
jgi:hypothetical protein